MSHNRQLTHSLSGLQEQKHLIICKRVDLEHRRRAAVAGKTKSAEMLKIFDGNRIHKLFLIVRPSVHCRGEETNRAGSQKVNSYVAKATNSASEKHAA
jgi:hypothetical protein